MLSFLSVLKDDAIKIKNETKLLIAADKTTNFYKLEPSKTKTKRCFKVFKFTAYYVNFSSIYTIVT